MSRRNNYDVPSMLRLIQDVELVEDWAKDRKKKIEDDMKKKSEEKKDWTWVQWLQLSTFMVTVFPWIALIQYYGLVMAAKKLFGG
jgi:hypothetical protein